MQRDAGAGPNDLAFLAGGGEMGARMRERDWSDSPLGSAEHWPRSLKTAVRIMLTSRQPMFVWWGEQLVNLYNDAYKTIVGGKHPEALGQPASQVWREIWDQVAPRAESAMRGNEGTYDESLLLIMERNGYPEETYYTFSYSPVPNDEGGTGGILCANSDDTQRIIGERQLALLRELAARTTEARTVEDACRVSAACLEGNPCDAPFAMIYLIDAERDQASLAGVSGIERNHPAAPEKISLSQKSLWPLADVVQSQLIQVVSPLSKNLGRLPSGAWSRAPQKVAVVPIAPPGKTGKAGALVVGLSPFRLFDDRYSGFLSLVAGQIAASIGNAQAYEQERKRAELLAELDRAKTTFFSNVSHEFRTPLTLMLGPVEDLLAAELSSTERESLDVVLRNGKRLLKLVNTLLDFARIEAGRMQAAYEPLDLPAYTKELASVFQSAMEKAGLKYTIECTPLLEQAYVDRDMWEKIVLNLVSNAFKFTIKGEICVRLSGEAGAAVLTVSDTGAGIPAAESNKIFDRFHRVESSAGRSHEGTGIGLAMVQELVRLHGGSISVASVLGRGSEFMVRIPLGSAHLPSDRLGAPKIPTAISLSASPFVEEALRWLPTGTDVPPSVGVAPPLFSTASGIAHTRVLIADDNADMRDYVRRLLAAQYEVIAVSDGQQALAITQREPIDLIISDVMMPRLDGFGLLRALRADDRTSRIPIVLLSARAGEEARVEGLAAGADDYLTKPFSARELLARVSGTLAVAQVRREADERVRETEERLQMATKTGKVGLWAWDIVANRITWSDSLYTIHGIERESFPATVESFAALVYPDDLEILKNAIRRTLADDTPFESEFRAIRPDGQLIWLFTNAIVVREEGRPVRMLGATVDINQRKQMELALRESEQLLQSLTSNAPTAIFVKDLVGRYKLANRLTCQAIGRAGSVVGWTDHDLLRPEIAERVRANDEQVLAQDRPLEYEEVIGGRTYLSAKFPLRDAQGQPSGVCGVAVDITERKKAAEEVREKGERLVAALEASRTGTFRWDIVSGAITFDEPLNRLFGFRLGETARTLDDFLARVHPDDRQAVVDRCAECVATGAGFEMEYRVVLPDGGIRWLYERGKTIQEDGRPQYMTGACVDVTERRSAEEITGKQSERLRLLWEAASVLLTSDVPDTMMRGLFSKLADHFGLDTYFNFMVNESGDALRLESCLGIPQETVAKIQRLEFGQAICGTVALVRRPIAADHIQQSSDPKAQLVKSFGIQSYACNPLLAGDRLLGTLSFASRTREQFAPDELEFLRTIAYYVTVAYERLRLVHELRETDRRKDEFLATLAHELRNPLAPIRNALQILTTAKNDVDAISMAHGMMERQLRQMVRLIDDLLDVSRISRGKIDLRKVRVDLAEIVRNAVETSRPVIESSQHALTVSVPLEPVFIDADVTRMAQVLSNLLNNAAKYTDQGGAIRLAVERDTDHVTIAVHDNGIGIPRESLPRVFDMFTQVDRSLEKSQGGLGIGLTIVKRLVEMHGGTVEAHSEGPKLGSRFVVKLPLAAKVAESPKAGENSLQPGKLPRRRILVVDDNRDAAISLAMMLKILGNDTRTAHDGLQAIDVAAEFRPDLILLDIGMPKLNGYDACRRIREAPWGQTMVLAALTGWGQDEDRNRSRDAGFNHHLVKPVEPAVLRKLLADLPA